jgi:hypothetical protein
MSKWQHKSLNVKLVSYTKDKKKVWTPTSEGCGSTPLADSMCQSYWTVHSLYKEQDTVITCYDHMFDPATSWFEVVEIPNKKAVTCPNLVENTWLCCYPRPLQCIFNNGSEFLGAEFANTLDSYGIKLVPTTMKNPAANMVEIAGAT